MVSARLQGVLAKNVRAAIARKGVSIDTVADLAGVSRRQLYSVLSGEYDVTVGWLEKLAEVLDAEVWRLLQPDDESLPG